MKKKVLLGLTASLLSFGALAEQVNFAGAVTTSCAFSNYSAGTLQAHVDSGSYYLDGAVYGGGFPSEVDISYAGTPTFSITGAGSLDSSPNGTPAITQFTTGITFNDAGNNSAAAAAGAMNFTGQATKSFQLDNTSVTTDTARVRFAAKANSPFPVGNYTSHVVVSCQ